MIRKSSMPLNVCAEAESRRHSPTRRSNNSFDGTGKQVLANDGWGTSDQQLPALTSMAVIKPADKPPNETMSGKGASGFVQDVDCTDVLNSILE